MVRIKFIANLTYKGRKLNSLCDPLKRVVYLDAGLSGSERREHLDYYHSILDPAQLPALVPTSLAGQVPVLGQVA